MAKKVNKAGKGQHQRPATPIILQSLQSKYYLHRRVGKAPLPPLSPPSSNYNTLRCGHSVTQLPGEYASHTPMQYVQSTPAQVINNYYTVAPGGKKEKRRKEAGEEDDEKCLLLQYVALLLQ
ncbi:MAG: hypothetical protein Q9217_002199 [Psora testacea]